MEEKTIWLGKPIRKIFSKTDFVYLPLHSIVFLILLKNGAFDTFSYGGLFIFSVFMYWLIGRFLFKVWKDSRTSYSITNKNIIIYTEAFKLEDRVQEKRLNEIEYVKVFKDKKGEGTIRFHDEKGLNYSGLYIFIFGYNKKRLMEFHDIENAEEVAEIVRKAKREYRNQ